MDILQLIIPAIAGAITGIAGVLALNNRNGKIITDRFEKLTADKDAHDSAEREALIQDRNYQKNRVVELESRLADVMPLVKEFPELKKQVDVLQTEVTELRCEIDKALTDNRNLQLKLTDKETAYADLETKYKEAEIKIAVYEDALRLVGVQLRKDNHNGTSDNTNTDPA